MDLAAQSLPPEMVHLDEPIGRSATGHWLASDLEQRLQVVALETTRRLRRVEEGASLEWSDCLDCSCLWAAHWMYSSC